MTNTRGKYRFLIIYFESFLLLVLLGVILPRFIDYLLFYIYKSTANHRNSIFVVVINDNVSFIQYYYNVFRSFITY